MIFLVLYFLGMILFNAYLIILSLQRKVKKAKDENKEKETNEKAKGEDKEPND
jgi:beta-lactamase regulating signal transducer with metallopeptidase domain